jgi:hypothetical protein
MATPTFAVASAGAPIVAGQHHRLNSKRLQPRDADRSVLAGLVSQG